MTPKALALLYSATMQILTYRMDLVNQRFAILLPSDSFFQGYDWSIRNPRDDTNTMIDPPPCLTVGRR
ncbi:hypothetical protein TNCV_4170821 [Trichonephila clavipes]|nr:hypothetical protein TNCV_4170821 [Trichonephila clavipes]